VAEESPEQKSRLAAKPARVEIDAFDARLKFHSLQKERLQEVIELVRIHEDAEPGRLLKDLETLASGRATVIKGMRLMADITSGMKSRTKATGDVRAEAAWGLFVSGLYRHHPSPDFAQPLSLVLEEKAKGRS